MLKSKPKWRERELERYHADPLVRQRRIERAKLWQRNNLDKRRETTRRNRAKQKLAAIMYYSSGTGCCAVCGIGDIDVLCIDHINNGGLKHRQSLGITNGRSFHQWLKNNGYPPGFQILCANCNLKKEIMRRRKEGIRCHLA